MRIICDSGLRIPLDSQIVKTADTIRTIVAYGVTNEKKEQALQDAKVETICVAGENGQVDVVKLMQYLGAQGIDSVLVEGGGTLCDSMLRAGLVSQMEVFVAPKIFGGVKAKSPVEGIGIEEVAEATMLTLENIEKIGEDVLLSYKVREKK